MLIKKYLKIDKYMSDPVEIKNQRQTKYQFNER